MPDLPTLLASHAAQLAVAFAAGGIAVCGLAVWFDWLGLETAARVLDGLDEHKDDLVAVWGVSIILLRSAVLPNAQWVEVVNSGSLVWLVLAAGLGVGAGRLGKGLREKYGIKTQE